MSDTSSALPPGCSTVDACPLDLAYLHYLPNLGGNVFYAAVFGMLAVLQLFFGYCHRTWGFTLCFVFGLVLEVIGYAGRVVMRNNPFDLNNFVLYLVPLTIGPAFMSAGIYLCLARIVVLYSSEGIEISRIKPRTYSVIFVACDFISLVLQAAGGALAASFTGDLSNTGVNLMIAGLAFQVGSMALFISFAGDAAWRIITTDRRSSDGISSSTLFQRFLVALGLAAICILIRCVFRVAELKDGFDGPLANNEVTFMILEGVMMVVAATSLTIYTPGRSFQGAWEQMNFKFRGGKNTDIEADFRDKTPFKSDSSDTKCG
ncbi:RTA1-domain-containing protein [Thozetella sp. PMI_491]|nr:RTA1-domain-containing protein [Thozetella sp. PMI_491]